MRVQPSEPETGRETRTDHMRAERERIEQSTAWQRAVWWLSALGRIRIRIAQSLAPSDSATVRAHLESSLKVLDRPGRSSDPQAGTLRLLVLDRLIDVALGDGDVAEAATHLDRLDDVDVDVGVDIDAEWRAGIRWRVVEALRTQESGDLFLRQATRYVADETADAEHVADIVGWQLNTGDLRTARQLANAVHARHATRSIQTMRMLCQAPAELEDATEAARIAANTYPNSVGALVAVQAQAHALLARCAEVTGRDDEMLAQASAALALLPSGEGRYWHARALLRLGRSSEALAALERVPPRVTSHWRRLIHFARLARGSTLELVEPCVRALRGAWGTPSRLERELAIRVLAGVLRAGIDDGLDRITAIAEWSQQIEAESRGGPLPWCQYNIALSEMLVDSSFARAAQRLHAVRDAALGAYPVSLLRAACATVLGEPEMLRTALRDKQPVLAEFAGDVAFFRSVSAVFDLLRTGEAPSAGLLGDAPAAAAPLVTAVPVLGDIRTLLRELINDARETPAGRGAPAHVHRSNWAQWLHERISPDVAQIHTSDSGEPAKDSSAALAWDRSAWLQDFHPSRAWFSTASRVSASAWPWGRMAVLRENLDSLREGFATRSPIEPDQPLTVDLCPWWPADHPLQEASRQQARVEWRYLEGRGALRRGSAADALRWFRAAREVALPGLPGWLVARRFDELLRYWQGVALAHHGAFGDAAAALRTCVTGSMSDAAHAQLGLIGVATGDLEEARGHLAKTSTTRCAAARHLTTLLHTGAAESVEDASTTPMEPVYAAAALRRAGAERERKGDHAGAAQEYRQALSRWPGDPVAGARLARVWLRETFDKTRQGGSFAAEPALADYWSYLTELTSPTVSWSSCLSALHRLLVGSDVVADDLSRQSRTPSTAGWALLALRRTVAAGHYERAATMSARWASDLADDELRAAAAVLALDVRVQTIVGGGHDVAQRRGAGDRHLLREVRGEGRLGFWQQLLSFALDPSATEAHELHDHTVGNGELSAAQQAFAAAAGLFSPDVECRRAAAAHWIALQAAGVVADSNARDVASCLAAHAGGDDHDFVHRFAALDCDPDALPCELAELYVAASEARLRIGAIDAVVSGSIPDELADLADPAVRNVVGLAFARRAVRAARNDPRAALDDLEQAIDLIQ